MNVYEPPNGTVIVVVDVVGDLTINVKVAALSHPTALVKCAVCEPAALNVKPFHVYGNCGGQTLIVDDDVLVAFTVKFKVAALSQPTALVKCAVCEPAAVNAKPFQV